MDQNLSLLQSLKSNASCAFSSDYIFEEENLYLDLLKTLYSDRIDLATKYKHLSLLQEDDDLVKGLDKVEQVVGSLHELLIQQQNSSTSQFLCGQILVAATAVLIKAGESSKLKLLWIKHREVLLQALQPPNKNKTVSWRPITFSLCCQCLEEMEIESPGFLGGSCLEHIWTCCRCLNDCACSLQACANLLSTIVKNQSLLEESDKTSLDKEKLDLFASPTSVGDMFPVSLSLLDVVTSMSPASVAHTIDSVVGFLKCSPDVLNPILKLWLPRLIFSSDLSLVHLGLRLHASVKDLQFGDLSSNYHLKHLSLLTNHPAFPVRQKLLLLNWMEAIAKSQREECYNICGLEKWLPGPFDGMDMSGMKLRVLLELASVEEMNKLVLLIINCLLKAIPGATSGRSTVIIYRTLFIFYQRIPQNKSLENYSRLLVFIIIEICI